MWHYGTSFYYCYYYETTISHCCVKRKRKKKRKAAKITLYSCYSSVVEVHCLCPANHGWRLYFDVCMWQRVCVCKKKNRPSLLFVKTKETKAGWAWASTSAVWRISEAVLDVWSPTTSYYPWQHPAGRPVHSTSCFRSDLWGSDWTDRDHLENSVDVSSTVNGLLMSTVLTETTKRILRTFGVLHQSCQPLSPLFRVFS